MEIRYPNFSEGKPKVFPSYFWLSATATAMATATVAPYPKWAEPIWEPFRYDSNGRAEPAHFKVFLRKTLGAASAARIKRKAVYSVDIT